MKILEALERFVTQLQADGRSHHTIGQYRRHVSLFAAWARDVGPGGDDIQQLDHEAVARFLASSVATGSARGGAKTATTTNALRSSLKNFFVYLHKAGHVPSDPGRLIRRARCSPPPPRAISETDQQRLLAVLAESKGPEAERDRMLFALLLETGIRLGSALALDLEHVDLERAQLSIRRAKNDAPDVIFLNRTIKAQLAKYVRGRASGPLFLANGARVSQRHVQRRFSQWILKAKTTRQASCHSLRHAFALKIYKRSGDVLLVKEALRHRSIASTLCYARLDEHRIRSAL